MGMERGKEHEGSKGGCEDVSVCMRMGAHSTKEGVRR